MEAQGIQETKEVLVALNTVMLKLIPILKDGVQLADVGAAISALALDAEVKAEIEAALANIKAVGAELKDLSVAEGIELAMVELQALPKVVAALKA